MIIEISTDTEMVHRCLSCGRRIRSAESIAAGRGKGCRAKIRAAAKLADLAAWTERQLEQARELIEDGALIPAEEDGAFLAVSTDGTEIYRTTAAGSCTCPAGEKSTHCYHTCAATIVLAASTPTTPVIRPFALAA